MQVIISTILWIVDKYVAQCMQTVILYREIGQNEHTGICSYFHAYPEEVLIMNDSKKPGLLGGIKFHKYALSP